jgi:hypothetical protein
MLNSRKSTSAIERVYEGLLIGRSNTKAQLRPGEKVEILDMCGRPTGIRCTVQNAESHSVGVIWGGETITVGRSWLRKVC